MISKERLEELIEKEAKIYITYRSDVYEKDAKFIKCIDKTKDGDCVLEWQDNKSPIIEFISLERTFETQPEAYHQANFGDMERVEKLSLLSYRDLLNEEKTSDYYVIRFAKSRTELDEQYLLIISFKSKYIVVEEDIDGYINKELFDKPLTEANYLEACELVRKLWRWKNENKANC